MKKRDILLSIVASLTKKSAKDEEELLANSDTKNTYPKVLPPFGGEMGFEIRSFLGRVEPWLQRVATKVQNANTKNLDVVPIWESQVEVSSHFEPPSL